MGWNCLALCLGIANSARHAEFASVQSKGHGSLAPNSFPIPRFEFARWQIPRNEFAPSTSLALQEPRFCLGIANSGSEFRALASHLAGPQGTQFQWEFARKQGPTLACEVLACLARANPCVCVVCVQSKHQAGPLLCTRALLRTSKGCGIACLQSTRAKQVRSKQFVRK